MMFDTIKSINWKIGIKSSVKIIQEDAVNDHDEPLIQREAASQECNKLHVAISSQIRRLNRQ